MRTVFTFIFFFNAVLLMAGGPSSDIRIVNLSGEDISFTISYNHNRITSEDGTVDSYLEKGRNRLSVSADDPHPSKAIIYYIEDEDSDINFLFNSYINSLEIFDKNGKLVFNKANYLNKRSLVFARFRHLDDLGKHNYGTYYVIVLKTDLDRAGLQASHRTTERLNLRESADTKARVIKVIDKGEAVAVTSIGDVYERDKCWLKIRLRDGTEGWGVANYLTPMQ